MKITRFAVALFAALSLWLAPLAAQETVETPELEDRGVQLQFGGLVQTQFNTTTSDEAEETTEPLLRRSYGDPEGELSPFGGTLWTPGVNLYLGRNNRLMLNYDLWSPEDGNTESAFRAQMQLAF